LIAGFVEIELANVAKVTLSIPEREAERAADKRAMVVDHARAGVVEIWTGDGSGAVEKDILLSWGGLAQVRMPRLSDDLSRAANDHLPPRRMELGQPLGQDRDIGGPDLEQPVTAEGTPPPALQVFRLRFHHRPEESVGAVQNAPVRHVLLLTGRMTEVVSLW
jgi:hypothetical protein